MRSTVLETLTDWQPVFCSSLGNKKGEDTDANPLLLRLQCAQELSGVLLNIPVLGLNLQIIGFHRSITGDPDIDFDDSDAVVTSPHLGESHSKSSWALVSVTQLVRVSSHNRKFSGWILSQDTYLGCRFHPWSRHGWVAPLVGMSSYTPKSCWFNPWSGHISRLWVPSLVGMHTGGNQLMFLDSLDVFSEVESLGQKAVSFLILWGNSTLFSREVAPSTFLQ